MLQAFIVTEESQFNYNYAPGQHRAHKARTTNQFYSFWTYSIPFFLAPLAYCDHVVEILHKNCKAGDQYAREYRKKETEKMWSGKLKM